MALNLVGSGSGSGSGRSRGHLIDSFMATRQVRQVKAYCRVYVWMFSEPFWRIGIGLGDCPAPRLCKYQIHTHKSALEGVVDGSVVPQNSLRFHYDGYII
jgi:hypothetical protein